MNAMTLDNGFVGYEYKDVTVKRDLEPVYADGYQNFGWKLEGLAATLHGLNSVTLKFKRDRKIRNKAELTRLQRQFDSCATEIRALESSKSSGASVAAYTIGLIGTACMAGAVFSYLAGMLPLMLVLALPGFIGWIIPYFCFLALTKRKTAQVTPLIDGKYDEMYAICEKANAILAN